MKEISKSIYIVLFAAATIVYIFGLFLNIMEIDAAQYASISHEMLLTKSYTILHCRQIDYLDKPPLCFWLEVLSYKIFGINNFSYKLPSFLFTLLGLFSTFKLGKKLYSESIAWLSALILYTCQGFFLFNQDIRTDTMLTGAVIFAIWQLYEYVDSRRIINFILGFTAIAAAMLAKGPIGIMVPVIAIIGQLIFKKRWKDIFRIEWIVGIIYVGLLLLPFSLGLYKQYGSYGLKFYYWIQSFGRITGQSSWHENAEFSFFFHTFIWAFLPWAFLSAFAVINTTIALFKKSSKFRIVELLSYSGAFIPFLLLSLSKYKLPHYIFVLFPLMAIITASSVYSLIKYYAFWKKVLKVIQVITVAVLWILLYVMLIFVFPTGSICIWSVIIALNLFSIYLLFRPGNDWESIIIAPAITIIAVNFMLNTNFYPQLLNYQSCKAMANVQLESERNVYVMNVTAYSFDFYAQKIVSPASEDTIRNIINQKKKVYIITDDNGLNALSNMKAKVSDIKLFYNYPVTRLKFNFLNPATRFKTLQKNYLLKVN